MFIIFRQLFMKCIIEVQKQNYNSFLMGVQQLKLYIQTILKKSVLYNTLEKYTIAYFLKNLLRIFYYTTH